jgi:hypothetical protein
MERYWFSGFIAWFFPGAGHFIEGKKVRGIIIAVSLWLMFIIGALSGGLDYPAGGLSKDSFLLYTLNIFAKFGSGLMTIISMFYADGHNEAAARITYEYGGRLIEIAGLLNYLAVLDCIDIARGKKQ